MGETFHQHERGEITDEAFAEAFCRNGVIACAGEHRARLAGGICRITARSDCYQYKPQSEQGIAWWCAIQYSTDCIPTSGRRNTWRCGASAAADHIYLSQDLGMRKPEARIYQHVPQKEGFSAARCGLFDDNADNIAPTSCDHQHSGEEMCFTIP